MIPGNPDDEARFASELADCQPAVSSFCVARLRDRERGEELAQEALRIAWEERGSFRGEGTVRSWVLGIARNLCRGQTRKIADLLTEDGLVDPAGAGPDALRQLRHEEQEELLLRALADLPEDEQDALYARYVEGLPRAEIAERMGLDDDGARVLLQRSRRRLERVLRAELDALSVGSSFFRSST